MRAEIDENAVRTRQSQYAGRTEPVLGEDELKLRLESFVDGVLYYRRNVLGPAKVLAGLGRADQARFLEAMKFLVSTSVELAYNFCQFAPPALTIIDKAGWHLWLLHLLDIYDEGGVIAAVAAMQNARNYADSINYARSLVDLEQVRRILDGIITGLNGRPLRVEASEEIFTDTETLHLPARISSYPTRKENFGLYKAMAIHQWAQNWFGTWRGDSLQVETRFDDPLRAIRLFHALELLRLNACIARTLPGIAREMERFRPAPKAEELGPLWQQACQRLQRQGATVRDSHELLPVIYAQRQEPAPADYQGKLNPNRVEEVKTTRIAREKKALRQRLLELSEELRNSIPTGDTLQPEPEPFQVRKIPDEIMPEEFRTALLLDEMPVAPPSDVQQLLDSIVQDLGDIPAEYLVPAGHGVYRPEGKSRTETNTKPRIDSDTYLYDEWDYNRQRYRKDWCHLRERPVHPRTDSFVEQTLNKHRGLLKHLHRTFEALREQDRRLKRQPYGDDIDIDALTDAYADLQRGLEASDRLFTRTSKQDRDIAVMFMVDMSGSTAGWINDMERESLVLLCQALEILGDRYAIYGFSGYTHKRCELFRVKRFTEPYNGQVRARISGISPQDYTRMGTAIRHLTRLLCEIEARTKLLITLSDGRPEDQDGYRGVYGIEDTRKALFEAKYLGIHPYCITIDEEASDYLPHMYGAANFSIIDEVNKLPYKVSEIYRRITR